MSFSVIVPSKTTTNLILCVDAVRKYEPFATIHIIDDGIDRSFLPRPDWTPAFAHRGVKPFIYARAVNQGIAAAGADDVVLLNDDAILQTWGGFSRMEELAEEHPEFGVIAAVSNNVGNSNQHPQGGRELREEPRMVCFIAVLIPRRTINLVGLLDERFGGTDPDTGEVIYGFDDDDYCLRVRNAGLKIGIYDGCYVDHGALTSTFRENGPLSLEPGRRVFEKKWAGTTA